MKLLNWKCQECDCEIEDLYSEEEVNRAIKGNLICCSKCGKVMVPFNFKNNSQAWRDTV